MKVFGSSALLALIFDEAGAAKVEALLAASDDNVVGAANPSGVLAQAHDAVVVTADRPWKQLKGFRFEFVR